MKKAIKFFGVFVCCFACLLGMFSFSVFAKDEKEEFPYTENDVSGVSYFTPGTERFVGAGEDAGNTGAPTGYTGYVMSLKKAGNAGVTLDYSAYGIRVSQIEKIIFCFYVPQETKAVRITPDAAKTWVVNDTLESEEKGRWIDFSVGKSSDCMVNADLSALQNSEGCLGIFEFGFRWTDDSVVRVAWLDCVQIVRVVDTQAPIITYNGSDSVRVSRGNSLPIEASAYDEYDGEEKEVEFVWSENPYDDGGLLRVGEYILTLRASDNAGNTAQRQISVTVLPQDTQPPVLSFASGELSEIYTIAGTYPLIKASATDNVDEVTVVTVWQDGALDDEGKLNTGKFLVTFQSEDLSGNKTEKSVTVHVLSAEEFEKNILKSKMD